MRITIRQSAVAFTLLMTALLLLPVFGVTQQSAWFWVDDGGDAVTLLLFGDTNIQNRARPGDAFNNLLPTLRAADARFANCEMLFVEPSNDPINPDIPHKLTWRHSHPSQVKGLVAAGFDAIGLTSNVTYPVSALLKSLPVLQQAGIPFTGSGHNLAEARRPVIIERKGVKIGFQQWTSIFWHIGHAATETTPGVSTVKIHTSYQPHRRINEMPGGPPTVITTPDTEELARFVSDIRALRQKVDIVVTSLQYGISSSTEVADYQRTLARAAIDAGADIVIGHGPHMLQPVEIYKGKPIFLSLGNFVFDWPKMREKQDGLLARAVIRDRKLAGVSFVPLRRDAENNPLLLDPNAGAGAEMLKKLRELGGAGGAELTVKGKEVIVGGIGAELSRAARQ